MKRLQQFNYGNYDSINTFVLIEGKQKRIFHTLRICSMNSFLSPLYKTPEGPLRYLLALTRSSFRDERHLAKTASPVTKNVTHFSALKHNSLCGN